MIHFTVTACIQRTVCIEIVVDMLAKLSGRNGLVVRTDIKLRASTVALGCLCCRTGRHNGGIGDNTGTAALTENEVNNSARIGNGYPLGCRETFLLIFIYPNQSLCTAVHLRAVFRIINRVAALICCALQPIHSYSRTGQGRTICICDMNNYTISLIRAFSCTEACNFRGIEAPRQRKRNLTLHKRHRNAYNRNIFQDLQFSAVHNLKIDRTACTTAVIAAVNLRSLIADAVKYVVLPIPDQIR